MIMTHFIIKLPNHQINPKLFKKPMLVRLIALWKIQLFHITNAYNQPRPAPATRNGQGIETRIMSNAMV